MRRLIWSGPARRDLYDIAAEYGAIDPDLELAMLDQVEHAPLALLSYPEMGSPTLERGLRKWPIRHTPFLLLYSVAPREIEIRRVVHGRSNWRALTR